MVYAIPRYQREYNWVKSQWENLFDEVLENDQGYFFGSIICINQSTDALSVQRLELVDGQQRLTTLSLLFVAIYNALKSHDADLDDEQRVELFNLKRKLVFRFFGYKNGLKLNEDLAKATSWSLSQIDNRTTKLVDQALALFKI